MNFPEEEITILAENRSQAYEQLKQQQQPDFEYFLVSQVDPRPALGWGPTIEAARQAALSKVLEHAVNLQYNTTPAQQFTETIEAYEDVLARNASKLLHQPGIPTTLVSIKIIQRGSKGLFGLGARPHIYELTVAIPACCEITYEALPIFQYHGRLSTRVAIQRILTEIPQAEQQAEIRRLLLSRKIITKDDLLTFCNCGFPDLNQLQDIQIHHTSGAETEELWFYCPICHKKLGSKSQDYYGPD